MIEVALPCGRRSCLNSITNFSQPLGVELPALGSDTRSGNYELVSLLIERFSTDFREISPMIRNSDQETLISCSRITILRFSSWIFENYDHTSIVLARHKLFGC